MPPTKSFSTFGKCLVLLGPGTRGKWLGLIILAIFVSVLEAITAVLVFVLLAVVMSPDSEIVVPVLGDLKEQFPSLTQTRGLLIAAAFIAAFFLFRAAIYFLQSYLQNRLAYRTGALLSKRLIHGYLAMPYLRFTSRNSAELIRNAHESSMALASWVLFPGIVLAAEAFVIVALCIILLLTSPWVALGAFAFLGSLVLVLLRIVQPRLHAFGLAVQEHTSASLKSIQQTLHGLRDIRLQGKEDFFEDDFGRTREQLARAYSFRGVLIDIPRISLETSVLLIVILFVVMQVTRSNQIGDDLTALGMFGYTALRVLPSVNRIVNNLQSLRFSVPLIDLLHQDVIEAEALEGKPKDKQTLEMFQSLELRNVTFRYPESPSDAVQQITLTIDRGETIGVVGQTGSGKSTLLDLIVGLLDPSEGGIYVNGKPLPEVRRAWLEELAVVSQAIFLLDDSIRNNVALGIPEEDIDNDLIAKAIETAQLTEFISTLPHGHETVVGERGVKLSGGQRQRIAIARAVYRQPSVLVLDEGTSALDSNTEARVLSSLSRLRDNMTLINVAHRMSTIRSCDRLVLITDGRIADIGSFDELVARNEEFESLTRSYFESSTDPQ